MIRLAHLGDHHFDESSRFAECIGVHAWIAEEIARRGVDLTVCSGDLFERRSTIRERIAAAEWLTAMTEYAPLVLVRGNHDATTGDGSDLAVFRKLRTKHPLIVEEAAGVHSIETRSGVVHVAGVAWPEEATAKAALARDGRTLSVDGGHVALGDLLRHVLRGIGDELEERSRSVPGPRVLAMHALVSGSVTSTGQPLIGDALNVGLEDLALARADYTALAHIHKHQVFSVNAAPAIYSGSPYRTSFGEVESKGFVVAELDDEVCGCSQGYKRGACGVCENRGSVDWELVETPCAKMFLLEDKWGPTRHVTFDDRAQLDSTSWGWTAGLHGEPSADADYQGASVRFRYHVDADRRDAARAAAAEIRERLLGLGAANVKLDEIVRPTTRARAPEIAKAATLEDQLAAMWATKRPDLGDERRARLLGKLGEVRA